jgi:preprotein translocase subunit Sec61beta
VMKVKSWRLPGGKGFGASVSIEGVTFGLAPEHARSYAMELTRRALQAEHDAAVVRLLTGRVGLDLMTAGHFLVDTIHPERVLDHAATAPLEFTAGLNMEKVPFLWVRHEGEAIAQLSPKQARAHAMAVLTVVEAAELDSTLERMLVGSMGLDRPRASAFIAGMFEYWPEEEEADPTAKVEYEDEDERP